MFLKTSLPHVRKRHVAYDPIRQFAEVSRGGLTMWVKMIFPAVTGQEEGRGTVLNLNLELKGQGSHLQFKVLQHEHFPDLLFKSTVSGDDVKSSWLG